MSPIGAPGTRGRPALDPARLAPYFLLATLVHIAGVASRFDGLTPYLPDVVAPALLVAQFPLLMLSGYFESRLDYGDTIADFPLWMRIKSKPVKLAFTFAFIYVCLVPLQTWDISIGPLDPTPPLTFPPAQRAMWFSMFTAGMFFPFYLGATAILIPLMRVLTWPLRKLPPIVATIIALAAGGGIGVVILAAASSKAVGAFIGMLRDAYRANPALGIAITAATTFGPMILGLVRGRDAD